VPTYVSEEHIASIFRVKKINSARNQRASRWQADSARSYIPEDGALHQRYCPLLFQIEVRVDKRKSGRFHCHYIFLDEESKQDAEVSSGVGAIERKSWLMHDYVQLISG
jgi:hypothetical protein